MGCQYCGYFTKSYMGAIIMKLDFKSLAFGYSLKNGSSTPAWETSLGQGKKYKLKEDNSISELVKGMIYKAVPSKYVDFKKGKGGAVVNGAEDKASLVIAAVFDKVYINEEQINGGKIILLIIKDDSKSHNGRLKLKYGPDNRYSSDECTINNQTFIDLVKKQFGLSENACWFISDISVFEQDKLVLKTTIINPNGSEEYENSEAHHQAWNIGEELDGCDKSFIAIEDLYETELNKNISRNQIYFGAPGTGKSYKLNEERKALLGEDNETDYERVTFHPDYAYANFVGTYKPAPTKDADDNDSITYKYVPGPFMRILVKALKNAKLERPQPYLIIVEEINRANVAAVFGDIFQLLDRDEKGVSEYSISTSTDMRSYLSEELNLEESCVENIKLPNNLFIWATMNSADQGVFPMDTAFKRRWDFTYLGINDAVDNLLITDDILNKTYVMGKEDCARLVNWNTLRNAINDVLSSVIYNINEDKLLGLYFISKSILDNASDEEFIKVFKNKVIMYLFDDAVKQKKNTFFEKCNDTKSGIRYSEICRQFDIKGVFIFPEEVSNRFTEMP